MVTSLEKHYIKKWFIERIQIFTMSTNKLQNNGKYIKLILKEIYGFWIKDNFILNFNIVFLIYMMSNVIICLMPKNIPKTYNS